MTPDQLVAVVLELADLRIQRDQAIAQANALAAKNAELHADIEALQAQAADCLMVHE